MTFISRILSRTLLTCGGVLLIAGMAGCQSGMAVETHRLIEHQALIDFSGLRPPEVADAVHMQVSVPGSWSLHGIEHRSLFNHQQWKSPSAHTAVGVIYARLPLPLSADTLLWFGRQQYAKGSDDGKETARWTDELGRRWFEAETNKYHCRGYAIADGLDAWIVYMGYKADAPPEPLDISLGARCMDTFIPLKNGEKAPVFIPLQQKAEESANPTTQPTTQPAAGKAGMVMQMLKQKLSDGK